MTFAWPLFLLALLIPGGLLAWDLLRRAQGPAATQPNILRAEAGVSSLTLSGETPAARRSRPRVWCYLGLSLGIVALARPQWGRLDEPVFEQAREILIAMDLSRSMLTPDVVPSRLERSKLLVQSLLDKLQGERVGLVVFSGTAFLQSPLSADYEVLREFLPGLGPDYLPEGGTNYQQLLATSIEAFGASNASDRFLIILSDGEATDDNWKDQIPALKTRGIRVIGLGVGTTQGGMIPDGAGAFLKDDTGAVVKSHLESNTLKALAEATGGVYTDASSWVDLAALVRATVDQGQKGHFTEENSVRLAERFQWFLAPAVLLLLVSFWREFPVRPKSRTVELKAKAAAATAVTAALLLLFSLTPAALRAADATPAPSQAEILGKIVGRLAAQDVRSALDWSEFAHQTLDWGQHVQSTQQPVPEVPVRDALAAVALGRQQDPKVTNWDQVEAGLNQLLKQPDPSKQPPKDDQKNQDKDKKDDQKKDDQNQQDQKKQDQDQQKQDKPSPKDQDKQNSQKDQDQPQNGGKDPAPPPQDSPQNQPPQPGKGESAFGDMSKTQPPPPPPQPSSGTKSVGGTRDEHPFDPATADPSLAIPLQKLQEVKDQDSPAQLYSLMRRGDPTPPPDKKGKNW